MNDQASLRASPAQVQEDDYAEPYHWIKPDPDKYAYFLSLLPPLSGLRVLDAGCGDGRFTRELAIRAAQTCALDYSCRAIRYVQALVPDAQAAVGSITHMPYDDEAFDVVVVADVLEHLQPTFTHDAVRELWRVLAPEGKLLLSVPSRRIPVSPKHYQHFSPRELTDLLSPCFHIQTITGLCVGRYSILEKIVNNRFVKILPGMRWVYSGYFRNRPDCAPLIVVTASKPRFGS